MIPTAPTSPPPYVSLKERRLLKSERIASNLWACTKCAAFLAVAGPTLYWFFTLVFAL